MILGVTAIVNRSIIIRLIPIVVDGEPGKVGISVITEENLIISMRIKDLRRPVLAMTTPCGLGLLVKLPHTQPYCAQEQEGITRASEERAWMAKTTWWEPTAWLAIRHANAPIIGMVILVTLPSMMECHARTRTRAAMVVRVWMARLIHHPAVAMVNGIAIALTIPPVYYANIPMLKRAMVTEQRRE